MEAFVVVTIIMSFVFTFINVSMTNAIMGIGTVERKNVVKWDDVKNILASWVLTIPSSSLDQTFITPFEREDIYSLSRAIDDDFKYIFKMR